MIDAQSLLDRTIVQLFWERAFRDPSRDVLLYRKDESYRTIDWKTLGDSVIQCTLGLYQQGVKKGDRVALLSENRPEWVIADLGILSIGAIVVPIYPTSSLEDVKHIVTNAGIEVLFLSNQFHFQRLLPLIKELKQLKLIILFDEVKPSTGFIALSDLLKTGTLTPLNNESLYQQLTVQIAPDDIATIIYTSGTTGPAKGVMLTHHNFLANCLGAIKKIEIGEEDTALSFLPLCHVFERLAGYYYMMFSGARIAYAQSMQTVVEDMAVVCPTVAAAVPRFYEKVYQKVMEKIQNGPKSKEKIFRWALTVGKKMSDEKYGREGERASFLQKFLASALVLKKIKKTFGGRLRFFISGGAPLNKDMAEFFYSAGILILEGYGLTETSPVIAVNSEADFKFGTVGRPLENCEVKIASDGEILTKGPCVMKGYYQNDEATREVIRDKWFYTGDIGELDSQGYLKITDRKKDIIKTSGGKMIAPQNIEQLILSDPLYAQIVILGDKRNFLVALIVPNKSKILEIAKDCNVEDLSYENLLMQPKIFTVINENLRQKIAHLASYEQIKYFTLLPKEFSQEAGELTPTLKVKRRVIQERYANLIEAMYDPKFQKLQEALH